MNWNSHYYLVITFKPRLLPFHSCSPSMYCNLCQFLLCSSALYIQEVAVAMKLKSPYAAKKCIKELVKLSGSNPHVFVV